MSKMIEEYAKEMGVNLPADYQRLLDFMQSSNIPRHHLDLRGAGNGWYFEISYQAFFPEWENKPVLADGVHEDYWVEEKNDGFMDENAYFLEEIPQYFGVKKVLVIAMAKLVDYTVGICYFFDEDGQATGLYAISLDRLDLDGKMELAKSLGDTIVIPELLDNVTELANTIAIRYKRKNPPITLEEIQNKAEDGHVLLGSQCNTELHYKTFVNSCISISNGVFRPNAVSYTQSDDALAISFEFTENTYEITVSLSNKNADPALIRLIDKMLSVELSGHTKDFCLYYHPDHPESSGLLFCDCELTATLLEKDYLDMHL